MVFGGLHPLLFRLFLHQNWEKYTCLYIWFLWWFSLGQWTQSFSAFIKILQGLPKSVMKNIQKFFLWTLGTLFKFVLSCLGTEYWYFIMHTPLYKIVALCLDTCLSYSQWFLICSYDILTSQETWLGLVRHSRHPCSRFKEYFYRNIGSSTLNPGTQFLCLTQSPKYHGQHTAL